MKTWQDIEGWFDFQDIYDKAVENAKDGDLFVEIGVYKGKSTCYMLEKIRESGKEIYFSAIDNFSMSPMQEAASNIYQCGFGGGELFELISEESDKAAKKFSNKSVSFLFIDGDHEYNAVVKDLEAWLPKMENGATIAGHDYQYVKNAVEEVLGDVQVSKSSWYKKL